VERCRITDEPARYRAGRIGIVLPGSGAEAAQVIADDMRVAIAGLELPWHGTVVRPTASAGVAALGRQLATREALIWGAEAALDEARAGGGDRAVVFRGSAEQRRAQA
jgi:PleD family two-component response regulator